MEKIILALGIITIMVFLYSKGNAGNKKKIVPKNDDPLPGVPDILGRPKSGGRSAVPKDAFEEDMPEGIIPMADFGTGDKRDTIVPFPQAEPDTAIIPDWLEEEEELKGYSANAAYGIVEGMATGVSFDELATVGKLLGRGALQPAEADIAVSIATKIDGTELLQLLEEAVGDASKRIAMLLDGGGTANYGEGSSKLRDDPETKFDIGDYV